MDHTNSFGGTMGTRARVPYADKVEDRQHGKTVRCPKCNSIGRLDIITPEGHAVEFDDAVWFDNPKRGWVCHRCWLR